MLNPEVQGQCNTFVNWGVRARGSNNNMTQLIDAMINDPGSDIEPSTDVRPSTIRSLSMRSLSLLRSSWFLFARKVDDEAPFSGCGNLADAFNRHVFTTPPQLLPGEGQIWAGHGMWADTRGLPINIISDMGSLKLHGSSPDMQATGFFCGTDMTVKFVTGYTTRASLSPDQQELRFENGAVWRRSPSSSPQRR